jgi:hypothetical protein
MKEEALYKGVRGWMKMDWMDIMDEVDTTRTFTDEHRLTRTGTNKAKGRRAAAGARGWV